MEVKKKQPPFSKNELPPDGGVAAVLKAAEQLHCSLGEQIRQDPTLLLMIEHCRAALAASREAMARSEMVTLCAACARETPGG